MDSASLQGEHEFHNELFFDSRSVLAAYGIRVQFGTKLFSLRFCVAWPSAVLNWDLQFWGLFGSKISDCSGVESVLVIQVSINPFMDL